MQLSDILNSDRISCNLSAQSKKRALEKISDIIAASIDSVTALEIFDCLLARERLGGTGIGHGVGIPHGRLTNIKQAVGCFVKLEQAVDFDAIDNQPVDLIFALLVPEDSTEEHLQILSKIASKFSDEDNRQKLRQASTNDELGQIIAQW